MTIKRSKKFKDSRPVIEQMVRRRIPRSKIKEAPYNPRIPLEPGDSEWNKLEASLQEFDQVLPLVWNAKTGNLVGGHQTLRVIDAKFTTIDGKLDVSVVSLTLPKEKALNIALNKIDGSWDPEKLAAVLSELKVDEGIDEMLAGFDVSELDELLADFIEDHDKERKSETTGPPVTVVQDQTPDVPEGKPIAKPGDLWQLGRHRILCGDSTQRADVIRLMNKKKADMVFTDPPYGVMYKSAKKNTISGDLSQATIPLAFKEMIEVATKENARIYICGGSTNVQMYFGLKAVRRLELPSR